MNQVIYRLLAGRYGAGLEIRILTRQTARAFDAAAPGCAGLTDSELLENYARFTAGAARRALRDGRDPAKLRRRLYDMASRLGGTLRLLLRPRSCQDCRRIITLLYSNIGIDISEEEAGKFCVRKCFFSDFYSPEICSLISAIDQGIFAGIYQGGRLVFSERITEGRASCHACFGKTSPDM